MIELKFLLICFPENRYCLTMPRHDRYENEMNMDN